MKKLTIITLAFITAMTLSGCSDYFNQGHLQKAGMLVEGSIHDQPWEKKGYEGLLQISEELDVEVYYKEDIQTKQEVTEAVDELVNKGVNLIFGHSSTYGKFFKDISEAYPDVHFVYFNGGQFGEDVTSLNFNSHAMGFFGGMVAGKMTSTNQVGVIGAYEWQPEIEGFYEGVKYQNPEAEVQFKYVNSWSGENIALKMYEQMLDSNVDVMYPTGDTYSEPVIEQAKKDGIYAIGYVSDQNSIAENTVLTSTVQHVEKLYVLTAEKFNDGELRGGVLTYDFQDEVISMGKYSPEVPEDFQDKVEDAVEEYKETGLLPNERESN
ncbi:BMP family ABC transporter substrate-binding protein [Virgibacillus doumboii]|uniref:BMP family ABC transporter substrate-binding protein n=1 Tax=Virgibacillus doumboii TaxID=2697503 RepID=UPI0013DFDD32|nr:BMP family ABC transporter substrate-binding protein [Virgibacillus doumboii]